MGIQTYLVGGAVRDELLGLPVKDKDWVVTGATPEDMIKKGFRPVGQDFPVFLHPKTKEEYALARTEKKSGHGYAGFTFFTSPDITVEEDLLRRDLTINAIAKDDQGNLIDPYRGQKDIQKKLLRHISPAFREDPLRILRVARFAARFAPLGFQVADETRELMREMVQEGEAAWLVAERVWQETLRALGENDPARYFFELIEADALSVVMPEIASNFQSLSSVQAKALTLAQKDNAEAEIRFACAVNSAAQSNFDNVQSLCTRMKTPKQFKEVAELSAKLLAIWQEEPFSPEVRLSILQQADGFRRKDRFFLILRACSFLCEAADKKAFPKDQLISDLEKCTQIAVKAFVDQGLKGKELAEAIQAERLRVISL
ncbi:hypothetical protein M3P05_08455 [Sansalvadorimonas sp. 2012CJ34-2]|uniref:CCA-adding enzyme n=1 Tax=Parendozoicomonas callyspongiae TaxID=2942213 RepID=A0ABT0PHJ8_9GAMM|nr:hypothetical protein [Sansalvadorimonas sp. 2012CJ34-2]